VRICAAPVDTWSVVTAGKKIVRKDSNADEDKCRELLPSMHVENFSDMNFPSEAVGCGLSEWSVPRLVTKKRQCQMKII
jgi:hypothetical protein